MRMEEECRRLLLHRTILIVRRQDLILRIRRMIAWAIEERRAGRPHTYQALRLGAWMLGRILIGK